MTYLLNNGQLQRMRTQEAFRQQDWGQSKSGLIFPIAKAETKQEEKPQVEWKENALGLLVPGAPKKAKPTCISLFTGAGGFDLGFHSAGFRIMAATDHDVNCAWTYGYNLGARCHFLKNLARM
jgi:hypothetical protein